MPGKLCREGRRFVSSLQALQTNTESLQTALGATPFFESTIVLREEFHLIS